MTEAAQPPTPVRTSVVAGLAQRVGIFGAGSAALGVMAVQAGIIPPIMAFMMFAAGCLFGGLGALVLGLVGLYTSRGGDAVGRRNALVGLGLGTALFALVYVSALPGQGVPRINDITTDLDDPPSFQATAGAPDYDGRDMSYPDGFAAQVREAYPDLAPIETDMAADLAYVKARSTAEELGWEIVWQDESAGVFNAVERSAVFRFVDDITVRVRATEDGARVDMRSKSRDGKSDLGANAARIRRFEDAFGR